MYPFQVMLTAKSSYTSWVRSTKFIVFRFFWLVLVSFYKVLTMASDKLISRLEVQNNRKNHGKVVLYKQQAKFSMTDHFI